MVRLLICRLLPFLRGHHQYSEAKGKMARIESHYPHPGSAVVNRRIWTSRSPLCLTYSMMKIHGFSLRPPLAWTTVLESFHSSQIPSLPSLSQVEVPPHLLEASVPLSSAWLQACWPLPLFAWASHQPWIACWMAGYHRRGQWSRPRTHHTQHLSPTHCQGPHCPLPCTYQSCERTWGPSSQEGCLLVCHHLTSWRYSTHHLRHHLGKCCPSPPDRRPLPHLKVCRKSHG